MESFKTKKNRDVGCLLISGKKWKDRSADGPISAKKPRKVKERQKEEMKKRESAKDEVEAQGSDEEGSSE